MLTPNQLDKLPEPMIQLMSELQDEIISDICRRITKANYLTPTAEWQLYKANQLTLSAREVKRRIAAKLKVCESTLKSIYTDAVKTAIREDEVIYKAAIAEGILSDNYREKLTNYTRSKAFSNALQRGLKNTNGLMRNLTNSAAAAANRQLSDALDLAYLKCASGAFTPQEAIFEAVKKLGADGLKCVSYESGRTDQLDVAVRRAVVTGIGKTCCDMQLDLAKEMDCELVEVTSHLGARPSHAEWQGQIYSLKKGHPKYPYFYDATGYGTGDGLGGWNCRHSFFPYFEGLSAAANAPTFTKEENAQVYADTQKQRAYERAIRKSKRELAGLDGARSATTDPELKAKYDREFERKSVTLKNREARLAEHLKATGLLPDNSRVRVDGFGKSVSQKAVWANKRYIDKTIQKSPQGNSNTSNVFNPQNAQNEFKEYVKSMDVTYQKAYSKVVDDLKFTIDSRKDVTFGYSDNDDTIHYNPNVSSYDNITILLHELAHRYDAKFIKSYENGYFSQAIQDTITDIDISVLAKDYVGKDISKNPFLSDILSAICENDKLLHLRFYHDNSYFAISGNREKEIFANIFSIEATQNIKGIDFLNKHFPKIMSEYKLLLEEGLL